MIVGLIAKAMIFGGAPCGASLIFWLDSHKKKDEKGTQAWSSGVAAGAVLLAAWAFGHMSYLLLAVFVLMASAGAYGAFWLLRNGPEMRDKLASRFTKKSVAERNKKTDIRDIEQHIPAPLAGGEHFDPRQYFDAKRGVFIGLSEAKEPLFIEASSYGTMPHISVSGSSGFGKGVLLAGLAAQWLRAGEAVFLIDPKDDEWAPHVMAQSAAAAGVPHHFINLRTAAAQFAMFDGATAGEIEETFIAGFSLYDKGGDSDFYSIADRRWAAIVAHAMASSSLTPAAAYNLFAGELEKEAPKFAGKLRELGEVTAANAPPGSGVSLRQVIEEGGSCYIVGSTRNDKIKRVQKMLLVRLVQIAEARNRISGKLRPVGIILDELQYHLSVTAVEALATARDKGVHCVLAFQSLADLKNVDASLNPEAVLGSIVENCRIKISYALASPETAEWFASLSGEILVDDETRHVEKNLALAEGVQHDRAIRQTERYLIDTNMLKSLGRGVAVVYGLGQASFAYIDPIPTEKDAKNIAVAEVDTPPALAEVTRPEDKI